MPTIEGKERRLWIDAYAKKAGKLSGVARAVRTLVMKTAADCEEYVSPWRVPAFDSNGPLCCFVLGKERVTLAFLRGAALADPEKLLEGQARFVRNIKLRSAADVKRPGVKKLIAEAAKLNNHPPNPANLAPKPKANRSENAWCHLRKGALESAGAANPLAVAKT